MKTRSIISIPFVLIATSLTACSGTDAPAITSTGDTTSALTAAIPQREMLKLDVASLQGATSTTAAAASTPPTASTPTAPSCQPLGPSDLGVLTHTVASSADALLGGVFDLVGHVTSGPPTAASPGHATWGPLVNGPAVFVLDVVAAAPNAVHFQLSGKPIGADDSALRGLFQGTTAVVDPTHGAGDVAIDFGAFNSLDPASNPVTGGVSIHFDNTAGPRAVDATFAGVAGPGAPQPNNATYHFIQQPDGAALFRFATMTDFDQNGSQNELLAVESSWAATGAGIAHANVSGGDLGSRQVNVVECWAPPIVEVFYADDVNARPPAGDQACCPQ